jgi:hypothetical protein
MLKEVFLERKNLELKSSLIFNKLSTYDQFINKLLSLKQSIKYDYNKLKLKQITLSKELLNESDKVTDNYSSKLLLEQEKSKKKSIFEEKFIQENEKFLSKLYLYEETETKIISQNSNYKYLADFIKDILKLYSILIGYYLAKKKINLEINKLEKEINELEYIIKLIEQEDYGKDFEQEIDEDTTIFKSLYFLDLQNYIYQIFYLNFQNKFYLHIVNNLKYQTLNDHGSEAHIKSEVDLLSSQLNITYINSLNKDEDVELSNIPERNLLEILLKINNYAKNKLNVIFNKQHNNNPKKTRNNLLNSNYSTNGNGKLNSDNCDLEFNKKVENIKKSSVVFYNEKGITNYLSDSRKATIGILNAQPS